MIELTRAIREIKTSIAKIVLPRHLERLPGINQLMIKADNLVTYKEASRLLFVLYLLDHLKGSYNKEGIYRWFKRRRLQLDGLSPAEILSGDWDPSGPMPEKVMELARSLIGN